MGQLLARGGDAAQISDVSLASVAVSDMIFYQRALNYQACDPECSVARRARILPNAHYVLFLSTLVTHEIVLISSSVSTSLFCTEFP
jgi:hypothetical protein